MTSNVDDSICTNLNNVSDWWEARHKTGLCLFEKNASVYDGLLNCNNKPNFRVLGCYETYSVLEKVKLIYSEKATKFCEIFILLLTVCMYCSQKVRWRFRKILWPSQNIWTFVAYLKVLSTFNYYRRSLVLWQGIWSSKAQKPVLWIWTKIKRF